MPLTNNQRQEVDEFLNKLVKNGQGNLRGLGVPNLPNRISSVNQLTHAQKERIHNKFSNETFNKGKYIRNKRSLKKKIFNKLKRGAVVAGVGAGISLLPKVGGRLLPKKGGVVGKIGGVAGKAGLVSLALATNAMIGANKSLMIKGGSKLLQLVTSANDEQIRKLLLMIINTPISESRESRIRYGKKLGNKLFDIYETLPAGGGEGRFGPIFSSLIWTVLSRGVKYKAGKTATVAAEKLYERASQAAGKLYETGTRIFTRRRMPRQPSSGSTTEPYASATSTGSFKSAESRRSTNRKRARVNVLPLRGTAYNSNSNSNRTVHNSAATVHRRRRNRRQQRNSNSNARSPVRYASSASSRV